MPLFQAITLAVIQGLTEFLPVSSSAHLLLVPVFTGWKDQGLAFDVGLHAGSLFAVVLYFRREIAAMASGWGRSVLTGTLTPHARLAWAVLLGTIPVGIAGLLLREVVTGAFRSPVLTAGGLIVFGLLLGWADWRKKGERTTAHIGWKDIFFIGCAQAVSLVPGTSRSGITITAGLLAGFSRREAARFSFLLSIPVIALAGLLETRTLVQKGPEADWPAVAIGMVIAGITAYACIHYFLAFIRRIGMQPFVAYRVLLGMLLFVLYL